MPGRIDAGPWVEVNNQFLDAGGGTLRHTQIDEDAFSKARLRLRKMFEDGKVQDFLFDLINAETVFKIEDEGQVAKGLLSNVSDSEIGNQTKRRLIQYMAELDRMRAKADATEEIYWRIASLVAQKQDKVGEIRNFVGGYKYVRYHKADHEQALKPVLGQIEISEKPSSNGDPEFWFEHRSHDYPKDTPTPEHTGLVFLRRGVLFMLGWRDGVLRLATVQAPSEAEEIRSTRLNGVVLSVRTEGTPHLPFAARAILFHNKCPSEQNFLAGASMSKDDGDLKLDEASAEAFRQIVKPTHAFITL